MTKKLNIILGLLLISGAILAQKGNYTLNGKLFDSSYDGSTVSLQSLDYKNLSDVNTIDTTSVSGGKFQFTEAAPNVPEIRIIAISNGNTEEDIFSFFIAEPATIEMQLTENSIVIQGGTYNTKHEALQQTLRGYYSRFSALEENAQKASEEGTLDEAMMQSLTATAQEIMSQMSETVFSYTKENMQNGIGEFYFINYASQFSIPQMTELYTASSPSFQKEAAISSIMQKYVWSQDGVAIGTKFNGITLENIDGKSQNISDYIGKGKVVLVDFWASWCMPCRKEMPELARFYSEQKDNGFELIGISLDDSAQDWKTAVSTMKMVWPQFLGDGGWNGKAAQQYGITRIPQTFILDRDGTIVARDLRGAQMEAKILELLAK
ncbi:TlpA disulfide reductase family protein [Dysgonomonas sp. 25]|uniref:TlpA disulfide reductase family protein n=1 Tax=Dysgonomonas sp. 25 TaxID=2302933 RepID=UPI0013CF5F2D|nr:TlpA disulfide reductase family protein [Dysgonomonas sp. 25]NDV69386.1 AhpC/TSA family protein [Dysgonomonas sp. 25]